LQIKPSSITFDWQLSSLEANGVITGFVIGYGVRDHGDGHYTPEDSVHFEAEERRGTIDGLIPGQTYLFQIQARTRVGYGDAFEFEHTMPVWAPPLPNRDVVPSEISHTMTTATIRFRRNYFQDIHGKVVAYAVRNALE